MTPRPRRRPRGGGSSDPPSSISGAQRSTETTAHAGRPGQAGGGQPNQPNPSEQPGTGESSRPEWLRQRIEEGNEFNRQREPYYEEQGGANEVHVEPRSDKGQYPRVDSYIPDEEIVSRKHTQLDQVQESTAVGYLREL